MYQYLIKKNLGDTKIKVGCLHKYIYSKIRTTAGQFNSETLKMKYVNAILKGHSIPNSIRNQFLNEMVEMKLIKIINQYQKVLVL